MRLRKRLKNTPPELVGDILRSGIYLCGGGSLLRGINNLIEREISVKATIIDDPLTCVARGAGMVTETSGNIRNFFQIR